VGHPLLHLAGGLVGEGDREDLPRLRIPRTEQVGDAVRQHAGLARARAGDDEQRPALVDDGLPLRAVEPGEHPLELAPDRALGGALEGGCSRQGFLDAHPGVPAETWSGSGAFSWGGFMTASL
jgi:hypothetical protein